MLSKKNAAVLKAHEALKTLAVELSKEGRPVEEVREVQEMARRVAQFASPM
jgi:hypothetical protein